MKKANKEDEFALTKSDMVIIDTLYSFPEGLRWYELAEKTKLSPNTLSKRLKNLQNLGLVERDIDANAYPPVATYKLEREATPTEGDVNLVFEALRAFNYIRKLDWFTSEPEARKQPLGSKADLAKLVKTYYSRLYPYFLWCLYYANRAETGFAEERFKKFYLDRLKEKITTTIHPGEKRFEKHLKEWISLSWSSFKENELKNEIEMGRQFFISRFPNDLQDLAESYYLFYLDKKVESWNSVLEELKQIVDFESKKAEFESYYGKTIPEHRLMRFLDVLTSIVGKGRN